MNHEERISPSSDPRLIAEHETRYRYARGAIEVAGTWCDLGCGTAAGSSLALVDALPRSVVLVDLSADALAEATRNLGRPDAVGRVVDLTSPNDLEELRNVLSDLPGPLVITCFEVIEHLPTISPIIGFLRAAAADGATVVMSAPNDVFNGVTNPYHVTAWGSSTFDELLQFLPEDRVVSSQLSVEGTTILHGGSDAPPASAPAPLPFEAAPFAFIVAFGPLAGDLSSVTSTSVLDSVNQRMWELQRATDLEYYRRRNAELEAEIAELHLRSSAT
ncbi:MAG: class I SAM-dependent methyltransferase [Acidimicrobiales bacterium]